MNTISLREPKTILLHALGIVSFLLIPVLTVRSRPGESFLEHPVAQKETLVFLYLLVFFYLNYFWWIPDYYLRQRFALYFGLIIVSYPIIALLPSLLLFGAISPPVPRRPHGPQSLLIFELSIHFFHYLVVVLLSLSVRINGQLKRAREQQTRSELDYLRSQINPHFLFNTLNSIYALALKSDARTPEAIVKLSGMMRYVYTETVHQKVPLESEISHIDDYISLQQLRLGGTAEIVYRRHEVPEGYEIAPLLLIPFIENAFKHGIIAGGKSWICIDIHVDGNRLKLQIENSFQGSATLNEAQGIGLSNTLARLELLYPNQYNYSSEISENQFITSLIVNLS